MNRGAIRFPGWASAAALSARRAAPFCEPLLGFRVHLGVHGPGLLPRHLQPPEHPRQAGRVKALAEARLEPAAQVGARPGRDAVPLRVGAAGHPGRQGGLLGLAQPRGPAGLGPVVEAGEPSRVVAEHRVAQRLALHAGEPGGLRPAHALQGVGDRQCPQGRPPVRLAPRVPAQRLRRQVVPDRQGRAHRLLPRRPSFVPARGACRPAPGKSVHQPAGIMGWSAPSWIALWSGSAWCRPWVRGGGHG